MIFFPGDSYPIFSSSKWSVFSHFPPKFALAEGPCLILFGTCSKNGKIESFLSEGFKSFEKLNFALGIPSKGTKGPRLWKHSMHVHRPYAVPFCNLVKVFEFRNSD